VRLQLRIATTSRVAYPRDDDALGQALVERVSARLVRGPIAPTLLVFREDEVLAVDVREALSVLRHPALVHRFIATFAGMPGVEAVAAVGQMRRGSRAAPGEPEQVQRLGGAFLEWSDGRWWGGWRPLDDHGRPMPTDSDDVQRAVDGLPRPSGLGGWFARARFEGLAAVLKRADDELVN
jgi:hypothetical protein